MPDIEKVIKGLECCIEKLDSVCTHSHGFNCIECPYYRKCDATRYLNGLPLIKDALELLKAQERRHALEVHNIGNVDIPDGVTEAQFYAVMNNVVEALEHTDRGESWPYDEEGGEEHDAG